MSPTLSLRALALASALAVSSMASAVTAPFALSDESSVAAPSEQQAGTSGAPALGLDNAAPQRAQFLADAAAPEAPNVHGFIEVPFKTAYITPRGLVVQDKGLVIQPVGGLVFPIGDVGPIKGLTFVTGIWNSIDTYEHDHFVGDWDEMDYFASFSGTVGKFGGTLTYSPWNFPEHQATTEHTADFKLTYDDTGMILPDFALKPYFDFFYSIAGDSPVINGRSATFYVELGVAPTYTWKALKDYPLTFTFPTYFSVGPEHFWGRGVNAETKPDGNFGVFSTAVNVSMPLAFIPTRYGFWHADAGLQYFYLKNDALFRAGGLASGNTDRNPVNASIGIGVNF